MAWGFGPANGLYGGAGLGIANGLYGGARLGIANGLYGGAGLGGANGLHAGAGLGLGEPVVSRPSGVSPWPTLDSSGKTRSAGTARARRSSTPR